MITSQRVKIKTNGDTVRNFITYFQSVTTLGIVNRARTPQEAEKQAKYKMQDQSFMCGVLGHTPYEIHATEEWQSNIEDIMMKKESNPPPPSIANKPSPPPPPPPPPILDRLDSYNPPDRTIDEQKQISIDISEGAEEIRKLRNGLILLRDSMKECRNTNIVDFIDALLVQKEILLEKLLKR